jgi:hypothetical protein
MTSTSAVTAGFTWAKLVPELLVSDTLAPILQSLASAEWPLYMDPEEKWYRTGPVETGMHQFLVQDPDGYLLRFAARLGKGAAPPL